MITFKTELIHKLLVLFSNTFFLEIKEQTTLNAKKINIMPNGIALCHVLQQFAEFIAELIDTQNLLTSFSFKLVWVK